MELFKNIRCCCLCLVLATGLLTGCAGKTGEGQFAADLGAAFQNLHGDHDHLTLAHITRFGWDRMIVFSANTPASQIAKTLGIPLPDAIRNTRIEERNDINLMIFLQGDTITQVSTIPRNVVDFIDAIDGVTLSNANAVFAKAAAGKTLMLAALD